MYISPEIPIDADLIIDEIEKRLGAPWNNGRINESYSYLALNRLFQIMNSGIEPLDFFYQGDLFRLHSSSTITIECFRPEEGTIIGEIQDDGSCSFLPKTVYTNEVVSYSKSPDFITDGIFYHVHPDSQSVLIHTNIKNLYGIDVHQLLRDFGIHSRFEGEQEVLFPLRKENIVKEYRGTPRKFCSILSSYV